MRLELGLGLKVGLGLDVGWCWKWGLELDPGGLGAWLEAGLVGDVGLVLEMRVVLE